jgi:polyisoprenoid-binding protein YceI
MRAGLALALLLVSGLAAAGAAGTRWPIDPARSQVEFSVRKFWIAHVRGTFPQLAGTLRQVDTGAAGGRGLGRVDATLAVAQLQMDNASERTHALGPGFFDAAKFPVIRFDSDPFPLDKLVAGGDIGGMLTLHGERHPVRLLLLPSDCPRQPLACVIRLRGTISRVAFGMRGWRGVLSDKVVLTLGIKLQPPTSSG